MRPPLGALFAWAWTHREDLKRIALAAEIIAHELSEIRKELQDGEREAFVL